MSNETRIRCALEDGAEVLPGLIINRFESSLVFFNADYFSDRVRLLVSHSDTEAHHFLLDAEALKASN